MISRLTAKLSLCVFCLGVVMAPGVVGAQSLAPLPLTADPNAGPVWDNAAETVPIDLTPVRRVTPRPLTRPSMLVPLYVGFGALQIYDLSLTVKGTGPHATTREGNPVTAGLVHNRAAMIALKGASTASVVFLGERLWKRHRVAAVVLMAGVNGAMAAIVAHNQRLVR